VRLGSEWAFCAPNDGARYQINSLGPLGDGIGGGKCFRSRCVTLDLVWSFSFTSHHQTLRSDVCCNFVSGHSAIARECRLWAPPVRSLVGGIVRFRVSNFAKTHRVSTSRLSNTSHQRCAPDETIRVSRRSRSTQSSSPKDLTSTVLCDLLVLHYLLDFFCNQFDRGLKQRKMSAVGEPRPTVRRCRADQPAEAAKAQIGGLVLQELRGAPRRRAWLTAFTSEQLLSFFNARKTRSSGTRSRPGAPWDSWPLWKQPGR
jgi:hypothetical protein